jgi:hypothetical protein
MLPNLSLSASVVPSFLRLVATVDAPFPLCVVSFWVPPLTDIVLLYVPVSCQVVSTYAPSLQRE